MLVLGLDTSESPGRVALFDPTDLAIERTLSETVRHAESLIPTLDALLEDCGREREDIERICVNLGPGSFTGLRIGLATAKGFAQARGIGLVGVDGTVATRDRAGDERRVCVAIASRRDLVYVRWFNEARPRTEAVMMHSAELIARLAAETRPLCLVGSAAERLVSALPEASEVTLGPREALAPSALAVARLGLTLRETPLHAVEPMYVEPILA